MEDTKLPHGPINEFFLRCLSERCDLTDEVGVGNYHPHVKHLTGIIILDHLYDFCFLARAPCPSSFFGSFLLVSLMIRVLS